jgi:hypothetical protein
VSWWSSPGSPEIQAITSSADLGVIEVQRVGNGADGFGLRGFFKLAFKGETTENILWDAPAVGAGSVKAALERLSTTGTVDVVRRPSRTIVAGLLVDVSEGAENMTVSLASLVRLPMSGLAVNDHVFVAGFACRIREISADGRTAFFGRVENFRVPLAFSEGFGAESIFVEKWAYGETFFFLAP